MKKLILFSVVLVIAMISTTKITAQEFVDLDKSPMDAATYPVSYRISEKVVKIIYSRPQLKKRSLEKLAPSGRVWRTGANEAAEITFYKDVVFGGKPVKAGTYSFFTIPGVSEWTIILNKDINVWGSYMYDQEEDVVRVKAKVSKSDKNTEIFSIAFDGKEDNFTMFLGWGSAIVSLPIKG